MNLTPSIMNMQLALIKKEGKKKHS